MNIYTYKTSIYIYIYIYILDNGHVPVAWQAPLAQPQLKRDGLDLVFNNFRPESNLQYISKLAESAVAKQLQNHVFQKFVPCAPVSVSPVSQC